MDAGVAVLERYLRAHSRRAPPNNDHDAPDGADSGASGAGRGAVHAAAMRSVRGAVRGRCAVGLGTYCPPCHRHTF